MKNLGSCVQFTEFISKEVEALKEAYAHRYWIEHEQEHKNVSFEESIKHFEKTYLNAWAEGYRQSYCQNTCKDRDTCNLGHEFLTHYQNSIKGKHL